MFAEFEENQIEILQIISKYVFSLPKLEQGCFGNDRT
jgi:hypothetical protein